MNHNESGSILFGNSAVFRFGSLSVQINMVCCSCSERRNKRALKCLKKLSPFTGLYRDIDKAVK